MWGHPPLSQGGFMSAARPLRADAQRNRDAILSAARDVFEADGVLCSLDAIAVRAGVGNATLYRNFPTRDDLLAAVIQLAIEKAIEAAEELRSARSPRDALAEWIFHLTWQLRIWHDLPDRVAATYVDADSSVYEACAPLVQQTATLLDAAKQSGDAVDDVSPDDVYELAMTLSWGVDRLGDDEQRARRRVALASAGVFTRRG
ncbi:TetR/AcrR family transcriptional regulator [Rhodococcus sp. BP-252]|nr:TetR/AcrR family transcriptional regulator [Rhodococcus sp. BP-320]MBY6419693.1 TetR/AcrR family transcriptional regulator [Rhodococcus sp. BP-321]MBY6424670.1 TetR/AcrR family transcriptional regulator [Rhodococcus sp. BP-324]MBY6429667.1 TetR/AcrR family transcriptional regulator [Rhodococcus sp. BP-323]MBY6434611.1 TetR/AcrR family transcriptional regulator [Rhodococcus sp. BP-322]MBY6443482.1 TetR/AcrR family transcriptional regulator [Rhodococcus sp. BP-319]MBY6448252.1 TetR/AcrR fami